MVKNPPANAGDAGDMGSIPGQEDPVEEGRLPSPVFLPEKSHGRRSLVSYSPRGRTESDTTEATQH